MYVVTLWPEPGRIKEIKRYCRYLTSLKKEEVLFLSQPEPAERASVPWHDAGIIIERKEFGCLQDWRQEEKEKRKGEGGNKRGGGRRGREKARRMDEKWEGKQRRAQRGAGLSGAQTEQSSWVEGLRGVGVTQLGNNTYTSFICVCKHIHGHYLTWSSQYLVSRQGIYFGIHFTEEKQGCKNKSFVSGYEARQWETLEYGLPRQGQRHVLCTSAAPRPQATCA